MLEPTLTAIHHSLHTIDITLKKSFYQGVSDNFYLLDSTNTLTKLKIQQLVEHSDYFHYVVECPTLDLQSDYLVYDAHMLSTPLLMGRIVRDPSFEETYANPTQPLGTIYTVSSTTFTVWAPTSSAAMVYLQPGQVDASTHVMTKGPRGIWTVTINGNLVGKTYRYAVRRSGTWIEANDPYAVSSTPNQGASVVVDMTTFTKIDKKGLPPFSRPTDAIVYELHVRDFSMDPYAGFSNPGKYKAFSEHVKSSKDTPFGLDYIRNLGVTHLQLLPIYDYGSVDELHPEVAYNWGYDPVQFGIPEGSYASNPKDPLSRVIETREMIESIHRAGLRVVMDVVYNHMFDAPTSDFNKLVPYYYFRYGDQGEISNGSFCGNDLDSLRVMTRRYILDMIERWITFYGIDGMRFDLMGILDDETMRQVEQMSSKLDPSFIIYGEGWNMPSLLPDDRKTTQQNASRVQKIGFFSDKFRELIKGSTWETEAANLGYATGGQADYLNLKDVLTASCTGEYGVATYVHPGQTVNYVECHDNMTLADKIAICNAKETAEQRIKRQRLVTSMVILSQGIPFLHAGQEWLRTKHGAHNSFRSSDLINRLDWKRMEQHLSVVDYIKDVIHLRKEFDVFRLATAKEIAEQLSFTELPQNGLLVTLQLKDHPKYETLKWLINPSAKVLLHNLDDYHQVLLNEAGAPHAEMHAKNLMINPISMIVLGQTKN